MTAQVGLCWTWSETTELVFPRGGSYIKRIYFKVTLSWYRRHRFYITVIISKKIHDVPYFCQKQFSGTNAVKVHTRKHIPFPPSRDSIHPTSLTPPHFHSHSFASSLLDPELRTTAIWTRIFCSTFSHCYSLSGRSDYGLLQQHRCPVILEI